MKAISYICFTLGLISIISGTTLAIQAIWVGANATLWKALMTCGVLFLASLLTAVINQLLIRPGNKKASEKE